MVTDFQPINLNSSTVLYTEKVPVYADHKSLSITPHIQNSSTDDIASYTFQVSNNGIMFYDYPHESALYVDVNDAIELPRRLSFLFIRFAVHGNPANTGQVVFKINYG